MKGAYETTCDFRCCWHDRSAITAKTFERTNRPLVLYDRRATERLHEIDAARETIIDGDFLDLGRLVRALQGCQSVFDGYP